MNVCVIGAGSMGTAVAIALERAGNSVSILATKFDKPFVDALKIDRIHPSINVHVPDSISLVEPDAWDSFLQSCEIAVVAVASVGVGSVVRVARKSLHPGAVWAVASKGWDPQTALPLSRVVEQESPGFPVVIVTGPSLAGELGMGTPTAVVCASRDPNAARKVADAVNSKSVRAFVTDDVAGVEVGGAMKNVLAIAIGMCDGITEAKQRPMTNTKAAVFSRGLIEMSLLAKAMGGRAETVLGLAGAGDLFVTVLGGRNGRFGRLVGSGVEPQKALEDMNTTVEGYENAREAVRLADSFELELPIVRMVHSVLFDGVSPEDAVERLVEGPTEGEM